MPASPRVPALFRDHLMEAPCTKCGVKMTLARIEPDKRGYDLRVFECTKCNNVDQSLNTEHRCPGCWSSAAVRPPRLAASFISGGRVISPLPLNGRSV